MRAWIVSIDEPIFYGRLYRRLIDHDASRIAGVILISSNVRRRKLAREVWYRLRFWGLRGFAYAIHQRLLARVRGTGDFAAAARRQGITVVRVVGIKDAIETLCRQRAELVVATVAERVPEEALRAVPGGWVNTHCGPLPRYAGVDAPFWCLYHGEPWLTVTLHYMSARFDEGPIISQAHLDVDHQPYFRLVEQLFDRAFCLHRAFLATGRPSMAEATPQSAAIRTYFGRPPVALAREFRRRGGRFV